MRLWTKIGLVMCLGAAGCNGGANPELPEGMRPIGEMRALRQGGQVPRAAVRGPLDKLSLARLREEEVQKMQPRLNGLQEVEALHRLTELPHLAQATYCAQASPQDALHLVVVGLREQGWRTALLGGDDPNEPAARRLTKDGYQVVVAATRLDLPNCRQAGQTPIALSLIRPL